MAIKRVSDGDYTRLLAVRTRLRAFEHWSAEQAAAYGLTASQHQLLLAVRGHEHPEGPTIGQVADYLLIRPHSAAELIDRAGQLGLVRRRRDDNDHRLVRLSLTDEGLRFLEALSAAHLEELSRLAPLFKELLGKTRKNSEG
jgi:DNA-binding MarR family transcriptional regulator